MRFRVNIAGDTYFMTEKEVVEGLFPDSPEVSNIVMVVCNNLAYMNRTSLMKNKTKVDRIEGTFNGITMDVTLE